MERSLSVVDGGIYEVQGEQEFLKSFFLLALQRKTQAELQEISSLEEINLGWGFFFEELSSKIYLFKGDLKKEVFLPKNNFLVVFGKVDKKVSCLSRLKFSNSKPWEEEKTALEFLQSLPQKNFNPKKLITLYGTDLGLLYFEYKKIQWLGSDKKTGSPIPSFFRVLESLQKKQKKLFFYWLEFFSEEESNVVSLSAFLLSFVVDWYSFVLSGVDGDKAWYSENIIKPIVHLWGGEKIQELFTFLCEAEFKGKGSLNHCWIWYLSKWELFWGV